MHINNFNIYFLDKNKIIVFEEHLYLHVYKFLSAENEEDNLEFVAIVFIPDDLEYFGT